MSTGPVEKKVQASSAAAAASGLLLWILGRYVFQGTVPDVIASWVYAAVPGVLAFAAGWLARHTPRSSPVLMPPVTRSGYATGGGNPSTSAATAPPEVPHP